ncbi:hypothetical protein [Deinococcus aestuarii]|uniref:hypothetical protein n=1 Tax=Deinococcus aestuarii TaxID=2774531 RepID=UPI001C0B0C84|nr:hypothetical protein [Deinococcus aestuarii]
MKVNDQRPTPGPGDARPGTDTDGPPGQGGRAGAPGSPDRVAWHAVGSSPEGNVRDEGRPPFTPEQLDAALERWR